MNNLKNEKAAALTDIEKRVFLMAIGRERRIYEQTNKEKQEMDGLETLDLVKVCDEIEKKVRAALWKT